MAEQIDLTTPETKPSNALYKVSELHFFGLDGPAAGKMIHAQLKGANGEVKGHTYNSSTTPTAAALLTSLNTANNSAGTSMIKRVYNRLIADGVLDGTVSGTPD